MSLSDSINTSKLFPGPSHYMLPMFPNLLKLILFACNKCHFWAKLKRSNAKNRPAMPLSFDSLIKKILTKLMLARKPMILLLENTQEKDNLVYLKFCNISIAAGIYLHKVSNRNTRTWCLFLWTLNIFHTLF